MAASSLSLSLSPPSLCVPCKQQRPVLHCFRPVSCYTPTHIIISASRPPSQSSSHSPLQQERFLGRSRRDVTSKSRGREVRCDASAAAGEYPGEEDPYMVLGVSPLKGFDGAMVAHRKKRKEAERKGDKEAMDKYDRAYNKIMMIQLDMRRKGVTVGSLEVSKEIKYADKRAIFPWLPQYSPVQRGDLLINAAISGTFSLWSIAAKALEWRPLQFLIFAFIFRIFLKLKALAKPISKFEEEEGSRASKDEQNRGILLRTLGLVFGTVGLASLGYSIIVKVFIAMGSYPMYVATGQELITTLFSALSLFIIATFYR